MYIISSVCIHIIFINITHTRCLVAEAASVCKESVYIIYSLCTCVCKYIICTGGIECVSIIGCIESVSINKYIYIWCVCIYIYVICIGGCWQEAAFAAGNVRELTAVALLKSIVSGGVGGDADSCRFRVGVEGDASRLRVGEGGVSRELTARKEFTRAQLTKLRRVSVSICTFCTLVMQVN